MATIVYVPYSRSSPQGRQRRKRDRPYLRQRRLGLHAVRRTAGRAQEGSHLARRTRAGLDARTSLAGHLSAFRLILFHAGFHFGVGLTKALMWMFVVVFVSGIVGAVLQHYMPRFTTERIPMETIYEQIGRVRAQLVDEAKSLVDEACASLTRRRVASHRTTAGRVGECGNHGRTDRGLRPASGRGGQRRTCGVLSQRRVAALSRAERVARTCPWPIAAVPQAMFQQLRTLLPPNLHSTVDDLENICEEKRELDQQARYHRVLHGWLLVHIPLPTPC